MTLEYQKRRSFRTKIVTLPVSAHFHMHIDGVQSKRVVIRRELIKQEKLSFFRTAFGTGYLPYWAISFLSLDCNKFEYDRRELLLNKNWIKNLIGLRKRKATDNRTLIAFYLILKKRETLEGVQCLATDVSFYWSMFYKVGV